MVGSEFQAVIPEGLCKYGDALPYENEDKLVWDPFKLQELEVERYEHKSIQLQSSVSLSVSAAIAVADPAASADQSSTTSNAQSTTTTTTTQSSPPPSLLPPPTTTTTTPSVPSISRLLAQLPVGSHLRDDEHSLYLLLQCGHNVDEALRRRRIAVVQQTNTQNGHNTTTEPAMSEWSEEECRNFESGLRIYGKDFHTIQLQKVRTRAVGELVQFYYVWKKTQRHDVFANKARLDKKKYSLHPGLTDYMDRFLEEQEFNGVSTSSANGGASATMTTTTTTATSGGGSSNQNNGGGNATHHLINTVRDRSVSPAVNSLMYNTSYRRYRNEDSSSDVVAATTTTTTTTTNKSGSSSSGGGRSSRVVAAAAGDAGPKML